MIERLSELWKRCNTKKLAEIFENYMKSLGTKTYDYRKTDNSYTFHIDGKSTNWNRVQCYYNKESSKYGDEDLLLVLRKEAGDYFIIQRGSERAYEIDYSGIRHYDEALLNRIILDHKPLFDELLKIVDDEYIKTTDGEIYNRITVFRSNNNSCTGCYLKGHSDWGQWQRIAADFLKKECNIDVSEMHMNFKKGWYKILPNGRRLLSHRQVRGSFPVMECTIG